LKELALKINVLIYSVSKKLSIGPILKAGSWRRQISNANPNPNPKLYNQNCDLETNENTIKKKHYFPLIFPFILKPSTNIFEIIFVCIGVAKF
jgi:hypothetical protein